MKKLALSLIIGVGVLSASPTPTTAVYLTHARSVISPYTMSIYGTTMPALDIDSDHSSAVSKADGWTAYVSSLTGDLSDTYQQSATLYEAEAYIFSQITKPGISADTKKDLQIADWYMADLDLFNEPNGSALTALLAGLTPSDVQAIDIDIVEASASIGQMNYSSYDIVSDANSDDYHRNKEFMIDVTPEPATYALFGLALIITGAARQLARRKAAANR